MSKRQRGFYTAYSLAPKRTGGFRLILDLCALDQHIVKHRATLLELRKTDLQQAVCELQWGNLVTAVTAMQELGFMVVTLPVVPLGLLHICCYQ